MFVSLAGYKELGIPLLEPYTVEKIDIKGSGPQSFDISLSNVKIYGMAKGAVIHNMV